MWMIKPDSYTKCQQTALWVHKYINYTHLSWVGGNLADIMKCWTWPQVNDYKNIHDNIGCKALLCCSLNVMAILSSPCTWSSSEII